MKRILVLTTGDIYERRGMFNAVINRVKHLKSICSYEIDVLLISEYEPWYVRKLRHTKKTKYPQSVQIDGIDINIKWMRYFLLDYILQMKLHTSAFFKNIYVRRNTKLLKGYDLVIAHSTDSALYALNAKKKYGIPYTVTWHGTDIHTQPLFNPSRKRQVETIIRNADVNFFVSKALLNTSDKITTEGTKYVLYNGYDYRFKKYSDVERENLRIKLGVKNKKVVTFAGNFFEVKNILTIPLIFKSVYQDYKDVVFWMIGDGKFRAQVESLSDGLPVVFWGNQEPESMPDFFNSTDVLILPSKNEGLPLTLVEATKCGCHTIGSLVGGIPEVIGAHNCVSLDDKCFVEKFAEKVVNFIKTDNAPSVMIDNSFDWCETAKQELNWVNSILKES